MSIVQVGAIGLPSNSLSNASKISLLSRDNFDPFNYVFWSISSLNEELQKYCQTKRLPTAGLSSTWKHIHWEKTKSELIRRLAELEAHVAAGLILVVVVDCPIPSVVIQDEGGKRSRSAMTDFPVLRHLALVESRGQIVIYCGPEDGKKSGNALESALEYVGHFGGKSIHPLFRVPTKVAGRDICVAGYVEPRDAKGIIAFIPPIQHWLADSPNLTPNRTSYLLAIVDILEPIQEVVESGESDVIHCRAPGLWQGGARCGRLTIAARRTGAACAIPAI